MIRIIIFIYLSFLSTFVYSANYPYDCPVIEYKDVPVYTRIPDSQLTYENIEQIWRSRERGSDECMVPVTPVFVDGRIRESGSYWNGYTSQQWTDAGNQSPWGLRDSVGMPYGTHALNCEKENESAPEPYRSSVNAGTKIFVGLKYKRCNDKDGNTSNDNNTDGCYSVSYDVVEVTTPRTCWEYVCEETDHGFPGGLYDCQVYCPDFKRPSKKYLISGTYRAYACRYEPEDDIEEEEEFCFTCLIEQFTDSVLYALDTIYSQIQSIFDRFLQENECNSEDGTCENECNSEDGICENESQPELEEVLLPAENSDFSVTQLVKNLFPTSAQCPQDSDLNILGANISFSYLRICDALSYLGTLLMILSLYASYRIIRSA